jgi:hypothetical protein
MKFKQIIYLAILIVAYSCASVGVKISKQVPAREKGCHLDIYYDSTVIKRSYEVIAILDSKTGSTAFSDKTIDGAINLAKPKACQCGADAMLVCKTDKEGISFGSWGKGMAVIKCLKYKDK